MNNLALINGIKRSQWLIDLSGEDIYTPLLNKLQAGEDLTHLFSESENEVLVLDKSLKHQTFNDEAGADLSNQSFEAGSIAVFPMKDTLMKDDHCGAPGTMTMANMVKQLSANPNVNTIIFDIDSPGGQANGVKVMADAVRESGKRTVAFIEEGMAASGAFWIASACDEIYVSQKLDQVGSIGAMTGFRVENDEFVKVVYAPQSTRKNYETREAKAGNIEPIEEKLRPLAESFINTVKANRGNRLKSDDAFDGRMMYAEEAMQMGLIDGIKSREQLMQDEFAAIETKQSKPINYMKQFVKVNSTLGVEQLEATDEGVFLNEEQLASIDEALAGTETAVSAAVNPLNARIEELQAEVTAANTMGETLVSNIETMCAQFELEAGETAEESLNVLTAHVTELQKKPSVTAATLKPASVEDDAVDAFDIANDPIQKQMAAAMGNPTIFQSK